MLILAFDAVYLLSTVDFTLIGINFFEYTLPIIIVNVVLYLISKIRKDSGVPELKM